MRALPHPLRREKGCSPRIMQALPRPTLQIFSLAPPWRQNAPPHAYSSRRSETKLIWPTRPDLNFYFVVPCCSFVSPLLLLVPSLFFCSSFIVPHCSIIVLSLFLRWSFVVPLLFLYCCFVSSVRSSSGYHGLIEIRSAAAATHFFKFFKFFRF